MARFLAPRLLAAGRTDGGRTGRRGQGFSFAPPRFGVTASLVLLSCVFSARGHLRLLLLCVVGPTIRAGVILGFGRCRTFPGDDPAQVSARIDSLFGIVAAFGALTPIAILA